MPYYPPAGGGSVSSASGGLAGTGLYYLTTSTESVLPNSLVIVPGSSMTHHITGSNYYLNATTSVGASSSGLAGKDAVYVLSSFNAEYTNAVYIRPGSSVTTHITGSNMFINAVTSTFAGSAGLAGKDAVYVLSSFNAEYTNAVYIRPGSSVTTHITGSNLFINAITGGGGASSVEKYLPYYLLIGSQNLGSQFERRVIPGRQCSASNANITIGADSMIFIPLAVITSFRMSQVGVFFASTAAGALLRLGIYTNSGDAVTYPFESIATSGIMAGSTGFITDFFTSQVLSSNTLYWFGIHTGTAASTIKGIPSNSIYPIFMGNSSNTVPGAGVQVVRPFSDGMPVSVETGGSVLIANFAEFLIKTSA